MSMAPAPPSPPPALTTLPVLLDQLPGAIWIVDGSLRVLAARGGALTHVADRLAQWIGRSLPEILGDDDVGRTTIAAHRRALDGEPAGYTVDFLGRSWEAQIRPLRDATGAVAGAIGQVMDVTARRHVEQALAVSEERFRRVFEEGPIGMTLVAPDHRLLRANRAFCELVGYSEDELRQMRFEDVSHPDDLRPDADLAERLFRGELPSYQLEKRYLTKSGATVWGWLTATVIRGPDGEPRYGIGMVEDVTARRQAERALRESERRLADAQTIAHLGSWEWDVVADRVTWSDELYRIFGLSPLEWEPSYAGYLARVHADDRERVRAIIEGALAARRSFRFECRFIRPDGSVGTEEARGDVVLDDAGRPARMIGIALDVTERARAEHIADESRRRLQTLSERLLEVQETERRAIARELHDEIGQALTALKLDLESARRSPTPLEAAMALEDAVLVADRTLETIRRLTHELRPSVLDDLGLAAAARWYTDRAARRAGLQSDVRVDLPRDRLAPSLETACFRIIQEALTNVARHAAARTVIIELRASDGRLLLSVQDDGRGFDVPAAWRSAVAGASLGLLGMQERVNLAGGEFCIDSAPGRGSTITASFPLAATP